MITALITEGRLSRREWIARGAAFLAFASVAPRVGAAAQAGLRIGFVDDNLENFHANTFLTLLRGPLAARGFTVAGCTALKEAPSRAWATKNGVPYVADVATLNGSVDAFMVMAPSTPETHQELCRRVLPFKKPTYVDKTFAPDLATAKAIFAQAAGAGTPMQTTSVLRFTNVQEEVRKAGDPVEHMVAWGGGGSFGEYAVHPLELLISVMGADAQTLMRRGSGDRSQLLVNFSGNRTGVVNVYTGSSTPYAASVTTRKGTRYFPVDQANMFRDSLSSTLDFFSSGRPSVPPQETLTIMGILDAAAIPDAGQRFIEIPR